MPLYEYRCSSCGERFELLQKFSDPPPEACTKCGKGPVERLLSSPAIQFKGTGWYITDYSQKGKPAADRGASGSDGKPGETASPEGGAGTKGDSAAKSDSKGSSDSKPTSGTSASESKPPSTSSKS